MREDWYEPPQEHSHHHYAADRRADRADAARRQHRREGLRRGRRRLRGVSGGAETRRRRWRGRSRNRRQVLEPKWPPWRAECAPKPSRETIRKCRSRSGKNATHPPAAGRGHLRLLLLLRAQPARARRAFSGRRDDRHHGAARWWPRRSPSALAMAIFESRGLRRTRPALGALARAGIC